MRTAKAGRIEIAICGLRELHGWATVGVTHLVSICGGVDANDDHALEKVRGTFPNAAIYLCFFDDTTETDAFFPPTPEAIRGVLNFTAGLVDGNRLLVHCAAGISRSTAIAFATLCQHWGPGFEIECYVELKWMRPRARPNALVVELADALLGMGGEMVRAVE